MPPCKNLCVGVHVCGLHCEIVSDSSSLVPRTLGGHKAIHGSLLASYPGHSQILSRSRGEKSGEGLGAKLCHGLEMVDSVSTNRVHVTY